MFSPKPPKSLPYWPRQSFPPGSILELRGLMMVMGPDPATAVTDASTDVAETGLAPVLLPKGRGMKGRVSEDIANMEERSPMAKVLLRIPTTPRSKSPLVIFKVSNLYFLLFMGMTFQLLFEFVRK